MRFSIPKTPGPPFHSLNFTSKVVPVPRCSRFRHCGRLVRPKMAHGHQYVHHWYEFAVPRYIAFCSSLTARCLANRNHLCTHLWRLLGCSVPIRYWNGWRMGLCYCHGLGVSAVGGSWSHERDPAARIRLGIPLRALPVSGMQSSMSHSNSRLPSSTFPLPLLEERKVTSPCSGSVHSFCLGYYMLLTTSFVCRSWCILLCRRCADILPRKSAIPACQFSILRYSIQAPE